MVLLETVPPFEMACEFETEEATTDAPAVNIVDGGMGCC
jgi:hypothetical protein